MLFIKTVKTMRLKGYSKLVSTLPLLLLVIVMVLAWNVIFTEHLYDLPIYRRTMDILTGRYSSSDMTRAAMMKEGIYLWSGAPLIGRGIDVFRYISRFDTYSHTNYTEILSGLGLIGLTLFYAIHLIILIKINFTAKIKDSYYRWMINFSVFYLLVIDFGMVSYISRPNLLLLYLLIYFVNQSPNARVYKQRQQISHCIITQKGGSIT